MHAWMEMAVSLSHAMRIAYTFTCRPRMEVNEMEEREVKLEVTGETRRRAGAVAWRGWRCARFM